MKILKVALLFILSMQGIQAFSQKTLTVSIPNINPAKGEVQISVWNVKKAFLKGKETYKTYHFKITKTSEKFVINDLPQGEYALSIFHDENCDKKCNKNILGMPIEGYGFSKNFKPKLSAPKFEDCSFLLDKDMSIEIKLIY